MLALFRKLPAEEVRIGCRKAVGRPKSAPREDFDMISCHGISFANECVPRSCHGRPARSLALLLVGAGSGQGEALALMRLVTGC